MSQMDSYLWPSARLSAEEMEKTSVAYLVYPEEYIRDPEKSTIPPGEREFIFSSSVEYKSIVASSNERK